MNYADLFKNRLNTLYARGLRRVLRDRTRGALNFSSNDYLNLAEDARLKAAAVRVVEEYGCGSTASRLMAGQLPVHAELETALARLVRQESVLAFPSGYQMNVGVVSTLFDETWTVFSDALNHASLIDGCRLSAARVEVYPHGDVEALRARLSACDGPKAIVTESVFSMDGDAAPLERIAELAAEFGAFLVVDEAHAIGVHGNGGGLCVALGILPDVTLGTLGKSLGSAGGFAGTSSLVREYLINAARGFIFSTGLAPASAGAALEAVRIVSAQPEMGRKLLERATYFRECLRAEGIDVPMDDSPIVPVILGENELTMRAAEELRRQGIVVHGIRPPTVPEGTSRLRLSVTLAHSREDLKRVAHAVADVVGARAAR